MRSWTVILCSLVGSTIVWLTFVWPLPTYLTQGIPSSYGSEAIDAYCAELGIEAIAHQNMVPGDHLQLMYHFWLAKDMIEGHTPVMYNLYEFNTGDDDERYHLSPYYIPFSLFFTIGSWFGGRALGFNFAGWASIWMTYLFSWLLIRRYTGNNWSAALLAVPAIALPFRWVALLGGSPSGFAMSLIPALLYGLDRAVADDCRIGGLIAGVAILLAYCSDTFVFYYGGLVGPFWCLLVLIRRKNFAWSRMGGYTALIRALLPYLLFAVIALFLSQSTANKIAGSVAAGGRSLAEVALSSPHARGLLTWNLADAPDNRIFLGYTTVFGGALCLGICLWRFLRNPSGEWRLAISAAALATAAVVIVLLCLGVHGPLDGRLLIGARKLVPYYTMVRQPDKILVLLPTVLCMLYALAHGHTDARPRVVAIIFIAAVWFEQASQITPPISLIQDQQAAYQAVVDDADDEPPRAMAIPLWPGNSHFSSIYEHFASLYRLRMVNGYRPFVAASYREQIFEGFSSVNRGTLTNAQLDNLIGRGIHYLLLHSDIYPEKVSPYPYALTLRLLFENPRIRFLAQDERVWAFKILAEPDEEDLPTFIRHLDTFFPARRYELERFARAAHRVSNADDACRRRYITLDSTAESLVAKRFNASPAPDPQLMIRARGPGAFRLTFEEGGYDQVHELSNTNWTWLIVAPDDDAVLSHPFTPRFQWVQGEPDLDHILLMAGKWTLNAETVTLPVQSLFHAGYYDPDEQAIMLLPDRDRIGTIAYGPLLPIARGHYQARLQFSSTAPAGTVLGEFRVWRANDTQTVPVPLISGESGMISFHQPSNLPIRFTIIYFRTGDMQIRSLTYSKMTTAGTE